ncbi:MAG: hypothetical protein AAGA93_15505, partial [Actinomycetota bacterium]
MTSRHPRRLLAVWVSAPALLALALVTLLGGDAADLASGIVRVETVDGVEELPEPWQTPDPAERALARLGSEAALPRLLSRQSTTTSSPPSTSVPARAAAISTAPPSTVPSSTTQPTATSEPEPGSPPTTGGAPVDFDPSSTPAPVAADASAAAATSVEPSASPAAETTDAAVAVSADAGAASNPSPATAGDQRGGSGAAVVDPS